MSPTDMSSGQEQEKMEEKLPDEIVELHETLTDQSVTEGTVVVGRLTLGLCGHPIHESEQLMDAPLAAMQSPRHGVVNQSRVHDARLGTGEE